MCFFNHFVCLKPWLSAYPPVNCTFSLKQHWMVHIHLSLTPVACLLSRGALIHCLCDFNYFPPHTSGAPTVYQREQTQCQEQCWCSQHTPLVGIIGGRYYSSDPLYFKGWKHLPPLHILFQWESETTLAFSLIVRMQNISSCAIVDVHTICFVYTNLRINFETILVFEGCHEVHSRNTQVQRRR